MDINFLQHNWDWEYSTSASISFTMAKNELNEYKIRDMIHIFL